MTEKLMRHHGCPITFDETKQAWRAFCRCDRHPPDDMRPWSGLARSLVAVKRPWSGLARSLVAVKAAIDAHIDYVGDGQ